MAMPSPGPTGPAPYYYAKPMASVDGRAELPGGYLGAELPSPVETPASARQRCEMY
jgi:hypothetical protein